MTVRTLSMGDRAVLVEDPPGGAASWSAGLRALDLPGVIDIVPAARTVLVRCHDPASLAEVDRYLPSVTPARLDHSSEIVELRVRYDGSDLGDVAAAAGCTIDEVVDLHRSVTYRVEFCGFAPGFAYLSGLPERLHLPRRSTPRTRVPAGSVAIAASYSAVYPTASPGGWHLLGSTDAVLFDVSRRPPALLTPGAPVRFVST